MKDVEKVVEYILKHPHNYPGAHCEPAARTDTASKPLESKAQMMIMWKALSSYLEEKLASGKNVNIKGFGAFAFDIKTDLPRIAARTINPYDKIDNQRKERKHVHKIQPKFVVDPKLQYHLYHYPGKEQVESAKSQYSIYQKGFQMIYCNPYPISAACMVSKDVVKDGLEAFWAAIIDLIKMDNDINLNFGFCRIVIQDRNLKVRFRTGFAAEVKGQDFEDKMRRSMSPCSTFWKTSYKKAWTKSNLGQLLKNTETKKFGYRGRGSMTRK
jgi:nucleoid DNA-binding protein